MLYGHRKGLRIIRLKSFHPNDYGNWNIKLSMTDMHSYMLLCQNKTDPNNSFIRYFVDEESVLGFIDFIKYQDYYSDFG